MGSVIFTSTYRTDIRGTQTYNVKVSYSDDYQASTNQSTVRITAVELQLPGNTTNWGQLAFFGSIRAAGKTLLTMNGGSSVRVSLSGGNYCPVSIPGSASVDVPHSANGSGSFALELVGAFAFEGSSYFCALYTGTPNEPFGVTGQTKTAPLTSQERQWTVSYNANGGSGAPAAQTKTYGQALTLSGTRPSRSSVSAGSCSVTFHFNGNGQSSTSTAAAKTRAYAFSRWNTASNGGGTDYNPGGSYTANAAATLYAQWTSSVSTASVSLPSPSRAGYSFAGWYTAASGGAKVGNGGALYTPDSDVTLYAHWTALASTIAFCSPSVATGSSFSLTVSRSSSAYYHKASFRIGNTTVAASGPFASSLSYTVPRSWFDSHPTSTTLSVTVSVQTYADSACVTTLGDPASRTFIVTADVGMKPAVSSGWATVSANNADTAAANISGFVKGYSKAQVAFNANKITMANGASILSYSIKCLGSTDSSPPYLSPVLNAASVDIVCTVRDSRNRTASETLTVSVMDYAPPKLSGISVFRCTSNGTASEDGTYYSVKATMSVSSLNNQNTGTLRGALAAAGGSYGTAYALTSGTRSIKGTISADTTYSVKITATDSLGNTASYYAPIPTRKWAMKFRPSGQGVAFGKTAEHDNALDIAEGWRIRRGGVDSNLTDLYVVPGTSVGSVSGETLLAKVQRAVSQEVIPLGKPFTGFFTSAARYYCDGFLYYSENNLYGYVNVSSYARPYFLTVSADVWTVRNAVASPLPVSEGGTGAVTAAAAKNALGLGSLSAATQSIANNSSADIPITSGSAGAIITSGAAVGARDLIWFNCNSSGAVTVTQMRNANGITVTTGTNKVTIANASGAFCYTITLFY